MNFRRRVRNFTTSLTKLWAFNLELQIAYDGERIEIYLIDDVLPTLADCVRTENQDS